MHPYRDPPGDNEVLINVTHDQAERIRRLEAAQRLDDTLWNAVEKLQRDELAMLHERQQMTIEAFGVNG